MGNSKQELKNTCSIDSIYKISLKNYFENIYKIKTERDVSSRYNNLHEVIFKVCARFI